MTSKSYSTYEKTEDFSDINDKEIDEISNEAKKNFISSEFKEKVKGFLYIDDAIRRKQEEISELKKKKKPCEDFIIQYLEKVEYSFIDVPSGGKLIKNESQTKSPLKMDIIKEAIIEKSKNEKIFDSEDKYNRFLDAIMDLMDKKRPIQKRVNLKRIVPRQKKLAAKDLQNK